HTHITKVSYPDADSLARRFMNCTPTTFANSLVNRKIIDIKRHGKYLWFEMADQQPLTPIFHFGMSGGFRIKSAPDVTYAKEIKLVKMKAKNEVDGQCESFVYDEQLDADLSWPPRFTRIRFTTATGHDVCYTDLRKFGRFHLVDSITPLSCLPLSKLGFDPYLDMPKLEKFIDLAQSYRSASIELKALLLDQSFCAGIGNWIADEILYQSSFHPRKRLNTLNDEQLKLLHKNIDYVIRTAVDAGGNERFPREWLFHYRWTNKRETEDYYKLAIKFDTVGGRTSAYVPQRQKLSNVEQQQVDVKLAAKERKRKSKEKTEEEDSVDEENKKIIDSADIKVSKRKISIKKMISTDSEVNEPLVKRKVPIAPSVISNRPQRAYAPGSGRPSTSVTEKTIDAVRTIIEDDPHSTYQQIETILGISSTAINSIIHDYLNLKKSLCSRFEEGQFHCVFDIIMGDESWFYHYDPELKEQSKVWMSTTDPRPTKVHRNKSAGKRIVAIFFMKYVPLETGATVNASWYANTCLPQVFTAVSEGRETRGLRGLFFHDE
ncbi:unnamed protein product, partial [Rotaria magnacalcarata]